MDRYLIGLLTQIVWDEADLNRQRVGVMGSLPTEGDGVLLCDNTDFSAKARGDVL